MTAKQARDKELAQLAIMLWQHTKDGRRRNLVADDAAELSATGRDLRRSYLQTLNGPPLTRAQKKRQRLAEERVKLVVDEYPGVRVEFNDDARGRSLRLHFPASSEVSSNNMGGEGWDVPE